MNLDALTVPSPSRPPLRYLGSKWRMAPKIIRHLPPHDNYVEPFGGSGAVLTQKVPVRTEVWNDLDGELVNLFSVLRGPRAGELIDAVRLTPYARREFKAAYEVAVDEVERARRLLVRSHMAHGQNGSRIDRNPGFRLDGVTGGTRVAGEWAEFHEQLWRYVSRWRGVTLESVPASELIARFDDTSKIPARWLLSAMRTWNWKRADLDPYLVLGYVVCVFMGAALKWRPAIYPIGDKASGKSSLLALIKAVLGDRLMDLADPSGPGIYQSLGLAAIGVWADEFEQEGESASDARAASVMRLARYASDGKNVVRGGADGVPTNYQARGTFGFTGINPPPMKPAELSRLAMPMLQKLTDAKAKAPELTEALGDELGRHLLRRIVDQWANWPDVLTAWRGVLLSHGHDSRAADTFGTLLAAAHLVLNDGVPLAKDIDPLAKHLPRATMAETQDDRANWEKCIDRLLQSQPDAWRQYRYRSVGEFLTAVLDERPKDEHDEITPMAARDRLSTAGLGLSIPTTGPLTGQLCLTIPSNHIEVAKLFERSLWSMGVGAVQGGWATALMFAPDDVAAHRKQRVDGRSVQCTLLALSKIIDVAGDGEAQTAARQAA